MLGLPTTAAQGFVSPFFFDNIAELGPPNAQAAGHLSVVYEPRTALGIANKDYVDRRIVVASIVSTDGLNYSGTPTPLLPGGYVDGALYLVHNAGGANTGAVTLDLIPTAPSPRAVRTLDGNPLSAGDLAANMWALLTYDAGTDTFILLRFIGGTLKQPLILAADPLSTDLPQIAATKNYVDQQYAIYSFQHVPLPAALPAQAAAVANTVITATVAPPDDGRSYRLWSRYTIAISAFSSNATPGAQPMRANAACTDGLGGAWWAPACASVLAFSGLSGCGVSPGTYSYPATITVALKMSVPVGTYEIEKNYASDITGLGTHLDVGLVLA